MSTKTLTTLSDPREILADASDVAGSVQFTDPVNSRTIYTTGDAEEPYFVVDAYAYGVARDGNGNDLDNMETDGSDADDFRVEIMVFETYCTDYTDPGSSEVSADVKYLKGYGRSYTEAPTEEELRAVLGDYLNDALRG